MNISKANVEKPVIADFEALPLDVQLGHIENLAELALHEWGLEDSKLKLIKHRENSVYEVARPDGKRCVLRVHRPGYHSGDELLSEHHWMESLSEYDVSTPSVLKTKSGETLVNISTPEIPETRQCDILGWVDGEPLGSIEDGIEGDSQTLAQTFHTIGAMAARVHNHGVEWKRPSGFKRHAWDLDGLTGGNPLWGRFWEWPRLSVAQRDMVVAARKKIRSELKQFGYGDDRFGLIHADFLPENLLVDSEQISLIDFDDGGFGWHLYEFVVALFFHLGEDHYQAVYEAMVDGYRTNRALPDEHLDMMPTFLAIRGLTMFGWIHTRAVNESEELITEVHQSVMGYLDGYLGD